MRRTVWSSDRFDRKLATLFLEFEGREEKLRLRLSDVIETLLDGSLGQARKHQGSAYTGNVPLIGEYVIVFSPRGRYREDSDYIDISETDHIDLLNIERRPR
jgi:hypothetical protein